MTATPWTKTVTFRILVDVRTRTLQQRWTRLAQKDGKTVIEEKWEPIPVVHVEEALTNQSSTTK